MNFVCAHSSPFVRNGATLTAVLLLTLFLLRICDWKLNVLASDKWVRLDQMGIASWAALFWAWVTVKLLQPNDEENHIRIRRMESAAKEDESLEAWYYRAGKLVNSTLALFIGAVVLIAGISVVVALPNSAFEQARSFFQSCWLWLRTHHSQRLLFVEGLFAVHCVTFWVICTLYAILDFTRPALLLPFKTQPDTNLSARSFGKACLVACGNLTVSYGALHVLWLLFPYISPTGFEDELPSLFDSIVQLGGSIPFAEIVYYFTHRLMHESEWLYKHIHSYHHTWRSPIAVASIYAHPLEHLFVNITTMTIGPMLMGMHLSLWYVWAILATAVTCHHHSGWHLPFLGSTEEHDYHQLVGTDNFGHLNVLDTVFHTNTSFLQSWQARVNKVYFTHEYPVDKIIARRNSTPSTENGPIA